MEVRYWHGEILGEAAVGIEDAHYSTIEAVASESLPAEFACATDEVNLTHHAFSDQISRSFTNLTDKLMPWNALKSHIASQDLQVGGADPSEVDTHEGGMVVSRGNGVVVLQAQVLAIPVQGLHRYALS